MNNYFEMITSRLTMDDLSLMGLLLDNDATASFKAISKKELQKIAEMSDANFRKIIQRLDAISFINIVTLSKEHRFYVTSYGVEAVNQSLESANN